MAFTRSTLTYQCMPIISKKNHLVRVKLPVETTTNLTLSVAIKAKYGEI